MDFSYLTYCGGTFAGIGFQSVIYGWENNDQYPLMKEVLSKGHTILAVSVLGLYVAEKLGFLPQAMFLAEDPKPFLVALRNGCFTTALGRVIGFGLINFPVWIDRKYTKKD
jgi:hypothetical protein